MLWGISIRRKIRYNNIGVRPLINSQQKIRMNEENWSSYWAGDWKQPKGLSCKKLGGGRYLWYWAYLCAFWRDRLMEVSLSYSRLVFKNVRGHQWKSGHPIILRDEAPYNSKYPYIVFSMNLLMRQTEKSSIRF